MSDGKVSSGSRTFDLKKNDANSFRDQENFFYVSRGEKIEDLKTKLDLSESGILLIAGPYFSGKTNLCYEWYDSIQEKKVWIRLRPGSSCFSKAIEELCNLTYEEGNEEIQMTQEDKFSGLASSVIGEESLTLFLDDFYEGDSCDHSSFVRFVRDTLRKDKKLEVRCVCIGHDPRMLLYGTRSPFKDENLEYQPFFSAKDILFFLEQIEEEYQIEFSTDDSLKYISKVILDEFGGHCGLTCSFLQVFLDRLSERKRPEYSSEEIGNYELLEQCLNDLAKDPKLCRKLVNQTRCETSYRLNMESLYYYLDLCKGRDPELQELQDYLVLDERTRVMIQDLFANGFVRIERIGNWLENQSEKKFRIVEVSSFHRRWAMERYRELWEVNNEMSVVDIQGMEEAFRGKKYHCFFKKLLQFIDVEFLRKKCCWSKIRYEGPSEKAFEFEFYRLLSQFSHFRTYAEYLVEKFKDDGKKKIKMGRMDIVLEVESTGEKYNIKLIANSAFSGNKHSVEQHWLRNLQKYDKGIVGIDHHFCIAFYHRKTGLEYSLVKDNFFSPTEAAEDGGKLEEDKRKQDLFYFVTNSTFSEMSTYYFNEDLEEDNVPFGKTVLEKRRMIDEEIETKEFNVFSFIKGGQISLSKFDLERSKAGSFEALQELFYLRCGGKRSPKKKKKKEAVKDEDEVEGEDQWEEYNVYDLNFAHLSSIEAVWKSGNTESFLYFLTDEEKKRKEEEEARKRKEEEEARKRKEEEEVQKLLNDERKPIKVRVFFVTDEKELVHVLVDLRDEGSENGKVIKKIDYEASKNFVLGWKRIPVRKKNPNRNSLSFYEYSTIGSELSGVWNEKVVGGDMRDFEDFEDFEGEFSEFLAGKFCFLVNENEKELINNLYRFQKDKKEKDAIDISKLILFRAGSGMSFLDKWFDDDDEEEGTGSVSVDGMKDEDSEWSKEIILECCDGRSFRKSVDDLLEKSRFFQMLVDFDGKEVEEARRDGKIKIEFLSSLELEYYLNVIFQEERAKVGGSENWWIRLLLRLLEFGMRYKERQLVERVVIDLEKFVIPDLVSCGVLELKLMELGHLAFDGLPEGLLGELLDRWCSHIIKNDENTSKMMRLVKYSSMVMQLSQRYHLKESQEMLDEDCERTDGDEHIQKSVVGEFQGRGFCTDSGVASIVLRDRLSRVMKKQQQQQQQGFQSYSDHANIPSPHDLMCRKNREDVKNVVDDVDNFVVEDGLFREKKKRKIELEE